jgi:hypothetical protein
MLEPLVGAVRVRRIDVHHRRVGPAGDALLREDATDGRALRLQEVGILLFCTFDDVRCFGFGFRQDRVTDFF